MKQLLALPISERLRLVSMALAGLTLTTGYAWVGLWFWSLLVIALGVVGWLLPKTLKRALGSPLFSLFVAAAAMGILNGIPTPIMLIAILFALAYWDLDAFQQRLKRVSASEDTRRLEKLHLQRLAWILGLGLALSLPGLFFKIRINLLWAMLLSLLIMVGIRWGITTLRYNQN